MIVGSLSIRPRFPFLKCGWIEWKKRLTQIPVWGHVKMPKSGFSPDWSAARLVLCIISSTLFFHRLKQDQWNIIKISIVEWRIRLFLYNRGLLARYENHV
jgi:hypothetical protein